MNAYWLSGKGRLGWGELTEELAGMTCAWADLDGFHLSPAPDQAPPTSHLWGWSGGRWARVRVDGDSGIVGLLSASEGEEAVTVRVQPAVPWANDARIPSTSRAWTSQDFTLLLVENLAPATFVHGGRWSE